jgi:hypothetical protein
MEWEEYTHKSLANHNFELLRLLDSTQQFVIAFSESDKSGALWINDGIFYTWVRDMIRLHKP